MIWPGGYRSWSARTWLTFLDIDSMLRRVHGKQKQGTGFGHAKVGGYDVYLRGCNPLIATICTPLSSPVIAASGLRAGNVGLRRAATSITAMLRVRQRVTSHAGQLLLRNPRPWPLRVLTLTEVTDLFDIDVGTAA